MKLFTFGYFLHTKSRNEAGAPSGFSSCVFIDSTVSGRGMDSTHLISQVFICIPVLWDFRQDWHFSSSCFLHAYKYRNTISAPRIEASLKDESMLSFALRIALKRERINVLAFIM